MFTLLNIAEFDLVALNAEIVNDPESLDYKWKAGDEIPPGKVEGDWKEDQVIANLINTRNLKIDRNAVEMEVIRAITEWDWYNNLSIDEQEFLRWKTPNAGFWYVSEDMKLTLSGRALCINGVAGIGDDDNSWWIAGDRPTAAPAMLALIQVDGSRAEVLWGEGCIVTTSQVGRAANL